MFGSYNQSWGRKETAGNEQENDYAACALTDFIGGVHHMCCALKKRQPGIS